MIPNAKLYASPNEDRIHSGSRVENGEAAGLQQPDSQESNAFGFVIPFPSSEKSAELRAGKKKHIAYQSKQINELVQLATRYAASSAAVMVTGESGTGKELFSRLLHEKSDRVNERFVALNCASVPESLMESEVFGHERGAFTGAIQKRMGYFEKANGGTLLLDEISEIPVTLQAKLLRVLEEQEIQPIGGDQPRPIDVRIVATSNRDLKQEVAKGRFRADLYHRLNVLDLRIPPLRERATDIPLLVLHFLEMFRSESSHQVSKVTKEAMQQLCAYSWPGNVRELRNVVHRACVVTTSNEISLESLPSLGNNDEENSTFDENGFGSLAGLSLAEVERKLIVSCLQKFDGNKKSAAEELGVTARTLSNKLKQYRESGIPHQYS